ncbi:SusC/RagA family TonB-linked outer membrane protein [Parabacteroides sp.]
MESQEVSVKPVMNVRLKSDTQNLDEIVVVGYGTQRKKDVTSSIAKVGGEDLSNLAAPSFDTQLAGRAAGVQVTTPSGVLGAGPQFKVRGMSTISSSSQPLFIVDGMPIATGDNGDGKTGLGQLYASFNAMSDINPNDIESIEILKDGAATAIYGSRAANGVVLITTKKGSKGRTKVTYDGYISAASATKLHDLLGAKDFVTIANEKSENWGDQGQAVYDPAGPNTNWNDYIFRTGFQHNHNVAASGGTDKSQYYVSFGFTEQEGIVRSNDMNRLSIKADLTQQATKWLRIGLNGQMSRTKLNGVSNEENSLGGIGFAGVRMLPNVAVFDPSDPTGYNIDKENRKTLGRGSNLSYIDNGIQNIIWALDNNVNRSSNTRTIGGGWAEITIMDGLTLKTQAGLDISNVKDYMYWDSESGDGYGRKGLIEEVNTTYENWNWQNILNYNQTFNELHNLSATAVQEYTHSQYEYTDAAVQQLSDRFLLIILSPIHLG